MEQKRIILVSQWFPPEQAPIGFMFKELAADLARSGWDVVVVTGFPNHPSGRVFGGYKKRLFLEEQSRDFRVWRVYLYTSARRTRLNRVFTFLTFTLSSCVAILVKARVDVIFSVLQPLSVGVILPFVAFFKRAKLVFNVQDLHPDVPIELGLIQSPTIIRSLRQLERFSYRKADALAVISGGFKEHCISRGANEDSVTVIPNWIDLEEIRPASRLTAFRSELQLTPDDFIVLYAGTIGFVSGAHLMIDVAGLLYAEPRIKVLFVGEGPLVGDLKKATAGAGLSDKVLFAPFQPRERLSEVQATSDVSVVTLLPGAGRASIPSKVLGYMAAARPVVASVDESSDTARLVERAGCGEVARVGDGGDMARAIMALRSDPLLRSGLGKKGRDFLEAHYARQRITSQYIDLVDELALHP